MSPEGVILSIEAGPWAEVLPDAESLCRRAALQAVQEAAPCCDDLPLERAEISVVLADDALVRKLNADYRDKDKPTNVLSFASLDDDGEPLPEDGPLVLGDVILAYETIAAEAVEQGKTLGDHLSHLVVHGVLHLLGFDHEEDDEAEDMEFLETAALAAIGIADPYAEDGAQ